MSLSLYVLLPPGMSLRDRLAACCLSLWRWGCCAVPVSVSDPIIYIYYSIDLLDTEYSAYMCFLNDQESL